MSPISAAQWGGGGDITTIGLIKKMTLEFMRRLYLLVRLNSNSNSNVLLFHLNNETFTIIIIYDVAIDALTSAVLPPTTSIAKQHCFLVR